MKIALVHCLFIGGLPPALPQNYSVTTLVGQPFSPGSADGAGSNVRFQSPTGIAVTSSGIVYAADTANHTIRRISPIGVTSTLAGLPGSPGSADGSGTSARFLYPAGLALDAAGDLYVADTGNHLIRRVTPAGLVTTIAGLAGVFGAVDGPAADARFRAPRGVAVDASGNLYVADTDNHTIRRISSRGAVTTLAGSAGLLGGDNGTGGAARFNYPVGIITAAPGSLIIADSANHTIRLMTATSAVSTLAGQAGVIGTANGPGSTAKFYNPSGVAVDATGTIYVADTNNHAVRIISPAGVVTTAAGNPGISGRVDGVNQNARFLYPSAVAIDGQGALFIADRDAHTVRQVTTFSAPWIVTQPLSQTVAVGNIAAFSVLATGLTPFTYEWRRNGEPVAGGTDATLAIVNAQPANAGTYAVVIANSGGSVTSANATLTVYVPPPNDNFANAQLITGATGTASGSNHSATQEPGEPGSRGNTVWYRWTPTIAGLATFDTIGSSFDTVLTIYTGTAVSALTHVASDDDSGGYGASRVTIPASVGTIYHIAISGYSGSRGNILLNWQQRSTFAFNNQPSNQAVAIGGSATFSVAVGGGVTAYQWFRNGVAIPGATGSTLSLGAVQAGDDSSYTVNATGPSGTITSNSATLTVIAPLVTPLTARHVRAGGSFLWCLASGSGVLVAAGTNGTILSSSDGRTWTPRMSGVGGWLVGATYGNGTFVVVGENGTILLSTDAISWTRAAYTGTTQRLNNVVYAHGRFVAVGEGGAIVTSTDARFWTARVSGVTSWLRGLAFNAQINQFLASGQGGVLLYSADGFSWTRLPVDGFSGDIEALTAADSYAHFVAIGQNGASLSAQQHEWVVKAGETVTFWSAALNPPTGTTARLRGIDQGAGALFATGENGRVITATDHRGPWFELVSGMNANLVGGLFVGDTLFIVGENETILQSGPLYGGRLSNLSTRGLVGTGPNLLISGFVITGAAAKQVLVRAAGPALTPFGLSGVLAAPMLTIVNSAGQAFATNTGWSRDPNAAAIATTAARVGAFPFAASSADSALLLTLEPGSYTAQIAGQNNTTGLSIVEVYDVDVLANGGPRAINISTRGVTGTGDQRLVAGFAIGGASSRRLLIRAVGPALAGFGVTGTLAEPRIELYNSRGYLHATAGAWSAEANPDEIRGAARAAGAFALPEGSSDAAMVVTLLPGTWTVQVTGPNNTTGIALIEVYALP